MDWPYHFLNLTPDDAHQRRLLLDFYGQVAQVSPLIIILFIQGWYLGNWAWRRMAASTEKASSSPYLKRQQQSFFPAIAQSITSPYRRFHWWCCQSLEIVGYGIGTKGQALAALAWFIWLIVLCFVQTGQDYLHVTKRFGIVGASQLPWQYLLSMKFSYSPLLLLTRQSHETINGVHQHLGRITTTLFYLHAGFYLNFYALSGLLTDKLQQGYVICGLLAIICFTILGTTTLAPMRKRYYKAFYLIHVVMASTILPLLYFHVSHIRVYIYETLVVLVLNAMLRAWNSASFPATLSKIEGTNLVEIDIAIPRSESSRWEAGRHAYISLTGPIYRAGSRIPLSVASLPAVDGRLRFVARILDGNTVKLAKATAEPHGAGGKCFVNVEGPYGLNTHPDYLLKYDRVLFVAGGIGATFLVPLCRQLLADLSPSKGSRRRQRVTFLWIARSMADIAWALPTEQKELYGFADRMRICLTSQTEGLASSSSLNLAEEDLVDEGQPSAGGSQGIEMEESNALLEEVSETKDSLQIRPYAGRPNIGKIVDQIFNFDVHARTAIFVCGPKSLSRALRQEVSRYIYKGREVWFWDENFSL